MLLMGQSKFTLYNLSSTWYTTSYMMSDTLNLLKKEWLWLYLRHWIVWWRGYSIFFSNFWCPFHQCPGNLFVSRKLFLHLRSKFSLFVYLGFYCSPIYHVYVWVRFIVSYQVFRTRTTVLWFLIPLEQCSRENFLSSDLWAPFEGGGTSSLTCAEIKVFLHSNHFYCITS